MKFTFRYDSFKTTIDVKVNQGRFLYDDDGINTALKRLRGPDGSINYDRKLKNLFEDARNNAEYHLEYARELKMDAPNSSTMYGYTGMIIFGLLGDSEYNAAYHLKKQLDAQIEEYCKNPGAAPTLGESRCDLASDSPINSQGRAHEELVSSLETFRTAENVPFFDSIERRKYSQALRRCCTVKSENSYFLLAVLLAPKARLLFDINETNKDHCSALHIAATRHNERAYHLLRRFGALDNIPDNRDITAVEYARRNQFDFVGAHPVAGDGTGEMRP